MLLARKWAIRHSGLLEKTYLAMERCLLWAAPLLRAIGYDRLEKPVARFEGAVKGVLFDCKMCGDCMLSVTGMSCWTNCPKGNRNGPCGGVRQDQMCEVDPNMRCVWVDSWQGSQRMAAGQLPITPNPPSDYSQTDSSSWLKVIRQSSEMCPAHPVETTEPATVKPSGGKLEQLLRAKTFVVTAEFSPPDSANSDDVRSRLAPFDNCVDAINVTDSSGANCHMSSLAVSVLLAQANCEPIMQMTCRDRNRIAIQADLLGASALGIKNMLCLTGDSVRNGDQPGAKPVGDLDAVTLLNTARTMRDEGRFCQVVGLAQIHLFSWVRPTTPSRLRSNFAPPGWRERFWQALSSCRHNTVLMLHCLSATWSAFETLVFTSPASSWSGSDLLVRRARHDG